MCGVVVGKVKAQGGGRVVDVKGVWLMGGV